MLKDFLERNETYFMHKRKISDRTYLLTLYNIDNCDTVQTTGVLAYKLHEKYIEKLKKGAYSKYVTQSTPLCLLIENEMYILKNEKLIPIANGKQPILVQQLKTKTKVIASGYEEICNFVRLLIVNGNMKGTKEHKREDRPLVRNIRLGDLGYKLEIARSWGGKPFLSLGQYEGLDKINYDLPLEEMKLLIRNNHVKLDQNYHTVVVLPKELKEETIMETNKALLFEFGKRNNKPIFEVQLQVIPSLEGDVIC